MQVQAIPGVGTPAGRIAGTRTLVLAQRLLALDDVWTAELETASAQGTTLHEDDLDALDRIAAEMQELLYELPSQANILRMMLGDTRDQDFEAALAAMAEAGGATTEPIERLRTALPDYDPRSAAIAACEYLVEHAQEEVALIDGQRLELREQGRAPGDLGRRARCALYLLAIGGGATATIMLGGAPAVVGLAVASQVGGAAMAWPREDCGALLAAIGGHRR